MKIFSLIILQIFSLIGFSTFLNCSNPSDVYNNCLRSGRPAGECQAQAQQTQANLLSPSAAGTAVITTPVQVSPGSPSNQGIIATTSNQGVITGITGR